MGVFADYLDIDAQINNILNRNVPGEFSSVGDISDSSDKRYSDALVTESRRKAAYRIFEAIGSNPSHPYFAELMELVAVTHDEALPAHFGDIGIPLIAPNKYDRRLSVVSKAADVVTSHTSGEEFTSDDVGRVFELCFAAPETVAISATIVSVDSTTTITIGSYTLGSTGTTVLQSEARAGLVVNPTYMTGIPVDPDWVDSARRNILGLSSNYFGDTVIAHDGRLNGTVIPSPVAGRYAAANGVFKFTGYAAKVPMIQVPSTAPTSGLVRSGTGASGILASPNLLTFTAGLFTSADLGRIVSVQPTDVGVPDFEARITGIIDGDNVTIYPQSIPDTFGQTPITPYSIYEGDVSGAEEMADTKIPFDLSALNVKLAMPLIVKEGDNLFRIATYIGEQGERELMMVKGGAVKVNPIDVSKAVQFGQKFTL